MQVKEAIQYIKEHLGIVDVVGRYVDLKQNGLRYVAPCPFHQETKPSFSVSPDKGFFYCFGCHAAGDIFEFYAKINGLDFKESLEELAAQAGISVDYTANPANKSVSAEEKGSKKRQILMMHDLASRHFIHCLSSTDGKECQEYIKRRGLTDSIKDRFELGWAPKKWHSLTEMLKKRGLDLNLACEAGLLSKSDNGNFYDRFRGRLMFPIKNLAGNTIAFGGRIIEDIDEAKYINSADTPIYKKKEHLYGLFQARRGISAQKSFILTEGYMDVLALWQFGVNNGVGVLGTALTEEQIRRLTGFASNAILIFDGDRAGRKAALRSCEMLLSRGLACKVVILPENDDIDSLLRDKGPNELKRLINTAQDGLPFCVNVLRQYAPREAVEWTRNFLEHIQIPELISQYTTILANRLGISEELLREKVALSGKRKTTFAISPSEKMRNVRDTQIITYMARYPERMEDLRNIGADLALCSERAKIFWELIEQWGPEEVYYHLDEKQKEFWLDQRGPKAAPLTNGDFELLCLGKELESYYTKVQTLSLASALADNAVNGNFDTDLEYLRALQEALEKKHE